MKDMGMECRDVRTREVGIQEIHHKVRSYQVELIRRDYVANGGWETFLSNEDPEQDILIGLLRLSALFRSIISPRAQRGRVHWLWDDADGRSREEHGPGKLAVISGVGTRNYYKEDGL